MSPSEPPARVLVVDDNASTAELIRRNLVSDGHEVRTAGNVQEALAILGEVPVDVVVTDHRMPGESGLDLVRHVQENLEDTVTVMITGYATIEGAVEAVKGGAEEYLAKPFTDAELAVAVNNALEKLCMRRAARASSGRIDAQHGLIGDSEAMANVVASIERAAKSSATVLVTGESGTGKELVARAIHYRSRRSSAAFVPVNCAGIPESLLESELFGHVKGAFTGATTTRAGFFQTAQGGTLFLDEISETSPPTQVKLLRVLQDREICMVGSSKPRNVDVRIIAATNKDPHALIEKGLFREDLYYRLDVLAIALPPLRERKDDVLPLVRHFATKFAREAGRSLPSISDAALKALVSYDWPGNVRELENVVQRLIVMSDAELVQVAHLPLAMRYSVPRDPGLHLTLAEVEAAHIRRVLEHCGGNKSRAAQLLGIDRKTLRKKLGLDT
ncbi:MAG: sigma-54-dependent transcriptional regulator [Planctomycetota bacterium]